MTHPPQPRIWWCLTGEFSVLPLHAACPYRKGQLNLVLHPNPPALIRARQHPSTYTTQRRRYIAIGQAEAAGETELPSVGGELDIIDQCIDALVSFTRVDGDKSTTCRVVKELGKNEWAHLTWHGLPNRTQPFVLHDGHLAMQQISWCDLKNLEFSNLSLCHTTVRDEESPDEVIHLVSVMQFVGFRSVIGTMWAVDESGCLDHTHSTYAPNRTMKYVRISLVQRILYTHLCA